MASVIASLWVVPDFETALLVTRFYGNDFRTSAAAALQNAQQWVRDTSDDEKLSDLEDVINGEGSWVSAEVAEAFATVLRDPEPSEPAGLVPWAGFVYVGA